MANDFSTGKSIFILAIVAGCFAILWPNIFYPMLVGSYTPKNSVSTGGCCDVIFDRDMNAIKIMTQLCEKILSKQEDFETKFLLAFEQGKLTQDIVDTCQHKVLEKCGVDITEFLREKVRLGKTYKQILDGIRSLNSSLCLKENFGLSMGQIGLPRHMRVWGVNISKHLRQERPPHLRPDLMHPALREKGRAIPHSHIVPKVTVQEGRPGPIPGLRPPMGGAGHVVPPPKGSGTMGIVMPMYTIGIVVFFLYTMMKLMFKKADVSSSSYDSLLSDPDFQRAVFDNSSHRYVNNKEMSDEANKLGDLELDLLKKKLQETEKAMERIVAKMMSLPHNSLLPKNSQSEAVEEQEEILPAINDQNEDTNLQSEICDEEVDGKGAVKVIGMEMTESCEGGLKWSRPPTPQSRPSTPQNIYLPGSVPSQSQLLVSDSHTETLSDHDNAVVLTGKVTLSLIGLIDNIAKDETSGTEASSSSKREKVHGESSQDIEENVDSQNIQTEELDPSATKDVLSSGNDDEQEFENLKSDGKQEEKIEQISETIKDLEITSSHEN